ncbi:AraC family transcriptional regulator [Coprobacter tertius]|uniref:AraC family transcriptional regulator n=1 Tax=Coprobacter tertius TaxID=2944915 RepID=A0ABT1MKT9_9BACT|nr:AraC family transcriptional regulator [Coprobacter tertius]MCP9613111.1 AraC family transcriptional regulator [Coprobacter tertius]
MRKGRKDLLKYLTINDDDERWGIVCTTVGYQTVLPGADYPVLRHPDKYNFKFQGRILNEYQLVYIVEGRGYFASESCRKVRVTAGTMIQLFPGEWHTYKPDKDTGWVEYWVGFRGVNIDNRVKEGFFSKDCPVRRIGISDTIMGLYDRILRYAEEEKSGYQQLISSIVLHLLGLVYYKDQNCSYTDGVLVDKLNKARSIMRETVDTPVSLEEIAREVGMGYSWFRRVFKQYTGMSPVKYQMQQRLARAKELLGNTAMTVTEVAYTLGFTTVSQFSVFFKKMEGMTASEFKERFSR